MIEINQKKPLAPNYPSLTKIYNNIGKVYSKLDQYSTVFSYQQHAFVMRRLSRFSKQEYVG